MQFGAPFSDYEFPWVDWSIKVCRHASSILILINSINGCRLLRGLIFQLMSFISPENHTQLFGYSTGILALYFLSQDR
ncbi:hypothetical protein HHK36_028235 [Tetracentron sinense]|uniref:Uncharacterized protein n=1 Tax=Tetracentron sinense TaxID=13715 RepID=A0A834YKP3_TETSI|nr:hypothetical protein HHK36_028235 [Tetracentron sinense]